MIELARKAGIYVGIFLAGGLISFVYSCGPLHNAKAWKIDYLEERLEARTTQLVELESQIAEQKSASDDTSRADELTKLRDDLASRSKSIEGLERKVAGSKKREKELTRSRDTWKTRHAKLEAELEELSSRRASLDGSSAAAAAPSRAFAPAASGESTPSPPASQGNLSDASGSEVEVSLGEAWESGDGRARFELVSLEDGMAKIIPDAGSLGPGEKPTVISVPEGGRFHVGRASGRPHQVFLTRINGGDSITVDITQ
jgi:hypothetical protein